MSDLTFKLATRTRVKPLIGLLGISGGGKTLSALLLARGLAGPTGRIGLIDTENGRGSYFCDDVPGGYTVINLDAPFSPDRYAELLKVAESEGIDVLVIDSMTHEWDGEGGYLEMKEAALDRMAGGDWKKREKCAMAAAAQVKPKHKKLVAKLLRCSMPVICCFRGKQKVEMKRDESGKTEIKRDDHLSAIQESDFMFEMTIAGEVCAREIDGKMIGGFFRCTKHSVASILPLLPGPDEQLSERHGEAIRNWAAGGSAPQTPALSPSAKSETDLLKRKLWALTHDIHQGDKKAVHMVEGWLEQNRLIGKGVKLDSLNVQELADVIAGVEAAR